MPSLREQLRRVAVHNTRISSPVFRLLEALVEAVEPGDTPTDEEYNDARDDRIRFLQKELAETNAERGRLAKKWGEAEKWKSLLRPRAEDAERGLAEAKAEIERLRQHWADSIECWRKSTTELGAAKAEIERLRPLAALGKMVRGMGRHTRLTRGGVLYKAETKEVGVWINTRPDACGFLWITAAKALQALQEVGNAKA